MNKVATWLRVSDPGQHPEKQSPDLQGWAQRRGLEVVPVYELQESAWRGAHQKVLTQVYKHARRSKFEIFLVWDLDRLSREGPLATLEMVHRLGLSRVQVGSYQEPGTEAGGELPDLLLAVAGWGGSDGKQPAERADQGRYGSGCGIGQAPWETPRKQRKEEALGWEGSKFDLGG